MTFLFSFTPIKHFISPDKSITYDVSSDCGFKYMAPSLAVASRLQKSMAFEYILQCIVVNLKLQSPYPLPGMVRGKFLYSHSLSKFKYPARVVVLPVSCKYPPSSSKTQFLRNRKLSVRKFAGATPVCLWVYRTECTYRRPSMDFDERPTS